MRVIYVFTFNTCKRDIYTHTHTHILVTDIRRSLIRANGVALLKNLAIDLKADEAGLEDGNKFSKVLYVVAFILKIHGH
jgi:hypothetical protein